MNERALSILVGILALHSACGTHTSIGSVDAGGGGASGGSGGNGGIGPQGGGGDGGTGAQGGAGAGGGGAQGGQPFSVVSFEAAGAYTIGNVGFSFVVGDVRGNSMPDLVVVSQFGVSEYVNQGDGTLVGPYNYPYGANAAALGDVNGDGKLDLVTGDPNGVSVLVNDGNGGLLPPVTYIASTAGAGSIALADVNGDGKLDIVAAGGFSITVLSNTGGGTFAATVLSEMGLPSRINIADLNGDSRLDLAFIETFQGEFATLSGVSVRMNEGTFDAPVNYAAVTTAATLANGDLNGDGKPDLLVGNLRSLNPDVLLNYGDGTFAAGIDYPTGSGALDPSTEGGAPGFAIGDLDGDGKADIAFSSWRAGVGFLPNKGAGTFGAPVPVPLNANLYGTQIALSDLDGDGKLDIVVSSIDTVFVFRNTSH